MHSVSVHKAGHGSSGPNCEADLLQTRFIGGGPVSRQEDGHIDNGKRRMVPPSLRVCPSAIWYARIEVDRAQTGRRKTIKERVRSCRQVRLLRGPCRVLARLERRRVRLQPLTPTHQLGSSRVRAAPRLGMQHRLEQHPLERVSVGWSVAHAKPLDQFDQRRLCGMALWADQYLLPPLVRIPGPASG